MKPEIYAMVFLFGSLWGSFFYTLAFRIKEERYKDNILKIFYVPSNCPRCKKRISYIFLFPFFGYFFSSGRCSKCKEPISIIYPLTELLYGIVAMLTLHKFGFSVYSLNIFILLSIAITISIIDFYKMTISNIFVLVFLVLSIYPVIIDGAIKNNFYGFLFLFTVFFITIFLLPGSFGGGDLKYAAVLGFLVGFDYAVIIFEAALILGSFYGIVYGRVSGKGLKIKIPFAPFLTAGLFAAVFYGQEIILMYNRFLFG